MSAPGAAGPFAAVPADIAYQEITVTGPTTVLDGTAHRLITLRLEASSSIQVIRAEEAVTFLYLRILQDGFGGHRLSVPAGWQTPNGEQPFHATGANNLSLATIVVMPDPHSVMFIAGEFRSAAVPLGLIPEGPGTGWTPASLGTQLRAWWNAEDAPSGAFATINDRVIGKPLTAFGGVLGVAGGWGGFARSIFFDGVDDFLRTTDFTNIPTGVEESELWALFDLLSPAGGAANKMLIMYGGTAVGSNRQSRISIASFAALSNGAVALTDTAMFLTGKHFTEANFEVVSGTASRMSGTCDGWKMTPFALDAAALNTTPTRFVIGASNAATPVQYCRMHLKQALITEKLGGANRRRMQGWLAWDGRIPERLPTNHPYRGAPP